MMLHCVLNTTLWTIKLNSSSLHFLPYKMGLIVFPYSIPKDFAGGKLNKESETAYKTFHHLGVFGYKQQIPSNIAKRELIGRPLGNSPNREQSRSTVTRAGPGIQMTQTSRWPCQDAITSMNHFCLCLFEIFCSRFIIPGES